MDHFSVDPEQFESAGGGFAADAESLSGLWQSFRDQVADAGMSAAGNDEIGGIIGEILQLIIEAFGETIESAIEEFTEAGLDIQEWGAGHQDADDAARAELESSLEELANTVGGW